MLMSTHGTLVTQVFDFEYDFHCNCLENYVLIVPPNRGLYLDVDLPYI